ncbi:hypothetical protein Phi46:1_gp54 [Cellulophaga phage phi46:1]|uniref:hypothetical protein n=1 Tax=Cellulophaga phage phi46:1 TaxID=1327974 RepID=UPI00035191A8|nr:hypothetical protein Phi46:1_gp54 [Cellulophaga phage phi46:1]AGO47865.1 hypothetical protein Phi46:1_gp54 [Cellulophaga phage phi46:1]
MEKLSFFITTLLRNYPREHRDDLFQESILAVLTVCPNITDDEIKEHFILLKCLVKTICNAWLLDIVQKENLIQSVGSFEQIETLINK